MDKIEIGKVGAMGIVDPEADGYFTLSNGLRSHTKCCNQPSSQDTAHPSKFWLENGFVDEAHTTTKLTKQNSGIHLRKFQ